MIRIFRQAEKKNFTGSQVRKRGSMKKQRAFEIKDSKKRLNHIHWRAKLARSRNFSFFASEMEPLTDVLDHELHSVCRRMVLGQQDGKGPELLHGTSNVIRSINKPKWNLKIDHCFLFITEFSFKVR